MSWRFFFGVASVVAPVAAYQITFAVIDGHAEKEYFEAISQILPVVLLALAIEQRYFNRRMTAPEGTLEFKVGSRSTQRSLSGWYTLAARAFALVVLILLGVGEWVAVEVLATGQFSSTDLKNTAGSLAAGFTALIITALVGTKASQAE
jgi:hypothetical protein